MPLPCDIKDIKLVTKQVFPLPDGATHIALNGISKLCKLKQNEIYGKVKENDIFASGLILFTIHVGIPPYEKSIQNDRLYQFLK